MQVKKGEFYTCDNIMFYRIDDIVNKKYSHIVKIYLKNTYIGTIKTDALFFVNLNRYYKESA